MDWRISANPSWSTLLLGNWPAWSALREDRLRAGYPVQGCSAPHEYRFGWNGDAVVGAGLLLEGEKRIGDDETCPILGSSATSVDSTDALGGTEHQTGPEPQSSFLPI